MINLFKKYIDQNNLIQPNDKVLLAVSGGIDSVVMLDLFDKSGISFAIAHCNFELRGDESDDDEKFVRQLALTYNVDIFINRCNATNYSKEEGISIQESARELRYAWFSKVCSQNDSSIVAVAHNQDDNIETFFINLFRGSGIKGLKGIPVVRQNIIRPLMFATRDQIAEYAKKNNIEFREDSSNSSDYYLRNKIRHHLIPKIEEISPEFATAAQKSINNLSDSYLILQSAISEKKQQLFITNSNGIIQANKQELKKLSPIKIWIYYLLSEYGFHKQVTDAICTSLYKENHVGLRFNSDNFELVIDRDNLLIRRNQVAKTTNTFTISSNQNEITDPINIMIEERKNDIKMKFSKDNTTAYFDRDKLTFPLTIRRWEEGDRMIPYGMHGSKLISDILINNKIDSFEKEATYVMLSGKKIIWLIGHRSSNDFRITEATSNIYVVSSHLSSDA